MDYEQGDLDHSEMPFLCPACEQVMYHLISDLEKNPQVRCPHCECLYTAEVEKKKEYLHKFFEKIKRFQNGDV